MKKEISGKLLFIMGLLLIGVSVFNIFKDPINNQYYKIKRQFSKMNSTPVPTLNLPGEKVGLSPVSPENEIPGIDNDQILETLVEEENSQEEGFLPVNVEIEGGNVPTPQNTREYDVIPLRISIPSIDLTADIINATQKEIVQDEKTYIQWSAPDEFAVGWHFTSSFLGVPGNTVLNGHHNVYGKVFENLDQLVSGDEIFIYGNDLHIYEYVVSNTMILAERDVSSQ